MKKIDETFMENRESDWLASEIKRERRASAWSFDDSMKGERARHEEDCEKDEVAREHATAHERYARANNIPYNQVHARPQNTSTVRSTSTSKKVTPKTPVAVVAIVMITFMIIAFTMVVILSSISGFTNFGFYGVFETIFSVVFNLIFIFVFVSVIKAVIRNAKINSRK